MEQKPLVLKWFSNKKHLSSKTEINPISYRENSWVDYLFTCNKAKLYACNDKLNKVISYFTIKKLTQLSIIHALIMYM